MSPSPPGGQRVLGCCYYPEHWPQSCWSRDARRMAEVGLRRVRIGEFAWRRIEPHPGRFDWEWLDRAIETLSAAGLGIVLGTPTATPPRWLLDRHPDMTAVDREGRPRTFGSRRHYCFSHLGYRFECARIVGALAKRYGRHEAVEAWQTDNEYGCHDTTLSYSEAARTAFRRWLRDRYLDIDRLNRAWGNVFWSMEYDDFDQIDPPELTVTEANPTHRLAFRRFSSDQVVGFNRLQVDIIRAHSDAPIAHNYMGRIMDFDHFAVGDDLDIAAWDSYPLGFLAERAGADADTRRRFARQGEPDFQAFHHDLYRAVGKRRLWIMEQQPGPVNWAPYNPAPLPGMVRLWSLEAFAHGAESVCYFRWRQAPFAQEQMHAGLQNPDGSDAPAMAEIEDLAAEIAAGPQIGQSIPAPVALLFDYDAGHAWDIQPHRAGCSYFDLVFGFYRALRRLGLSIDILPPTTRDFSPWSLVLAPGLVFMSLDLKNALEKTARQLLLGPRSAARDIDMAIPTPLPPDFPGLDLRVVGVESLGPQMDIALPAGGGIRHYREFVDGGATVFERDADGEPVLLGDDRCRYLTGWPDEAAAFRIVADAAGVAGIPTCELPSGLRRRETDREVFWINYNSYEVEAEGLRIAPVSVLRQARKKTSDDPPGP